MRHMAIATLLMLSSCGAIDAQMQQRADECAARGMALTASGCAGGGGGGFPATPAAIKCKSTSRVSQDGDTTTTDTDTACHS